MAGKPLDSYCEVLCPSLIHTHWHCWGSQSLVKSAFGVGTPRADRPRTPPWGTGELIPRLACWTQSAHVWHLQTEKRSPRATGAGRQLAPSPGCPGWVLPCQRECFQSKNCLLEAAGVNFQEVLGAGRFLSAHMRRWLREPRGKDAGPRRDGGDGGDRWQVPTPAGSSLVPPAPKSPLPGTSNYRWRLSP